MQAAAGAPTAVQSPAPPAAKEAEDGNLARTECTQTTDRISKAEVSRRIESLLDPAFPPLARGVRAQRFQTANTNHRGHRPRGTSTDNLAHRLVL
jgi:hypothetical protein